MQEEPTGNTSIFALSKQSLLSRLRLEYKRIGAYGLVGVCNTVIDFTILNILHFKLRMPLLASNLASTSIAMVFSYIANRHFVFRGNHRKPLVKQVITFWLVTAFGLYVLQTSILWLGTHTLSGLVASIANGLHALIPLSAIFIATNGLKLLATIVSLTWNYVLYKRVVFNT